MKVEVNAIKRPGVKVSVTLARVRRGGLRVSIPVRTAARNEVCPEAETADIVVGFVDNADGIIAHEGISCDKLPSGDNAEIEGVCEDEALPEPEAALPEDEPDEEELLALIAEEEAEMASQLQQQSSALLTAEDGDEPGACDSVGELFGEEPVEFFGEESSSEAADNETETNTIPFDVVQDGFFDSESADTDGNGNGADRPDQSAPVEQYMRYFDRSTDGEKVEVSDNRASGQEIICVNGESGRLSRVCGFIRNNQSAQPTEEDEAPDGQE